jgi:hypothetical protein
LRARIQLALDAPDRLGGAAMQGADVALQLTPARGVHPRLPGAAIAEGRPTMWLPHVLRAQELDFCFRFCARYPHIRAPSAAARA